MLWRRQSRKPPELELEHQIQIIVSFGGMGEKPLSFFPQAGSSLGYQLCLPRLAPLNRVYLVKFVYDSEVYPVAPEDVTGAYFTGVPLGCSTRVKQLARLPDEDRGFTREL
jgi:hypothetical protein